MSLDSKKDQIKGKIDEEVGKATGDDKKELKGKAEGFLGKAKDKIEDLTDKVTEKIDSDK